MKNSFVLLLLLLTGCQELVTPIKPAVPVEVEFVEPPEGVSFIVGECNGRRFTYVDGQDGVKSMGISFSSFSNMPAIVGFGETLKDTLNNSVWNLVFYFKTEEFKKNISNSTKLFYAGDYQYLLLDQNYNPVGNRGVQLSTGTYNGSGSGIGNTTLIQADAHSRVFTVERVYFNNLPNPQLLNPLIWIEGSFESWMASDVNVKGQFRIKTQASF